MPSSVSSSPILTAGQAVGDEEQAVLEAEGPARRDFFDQEVAAHTLGSVRELVGTAAAGQLSPCSETRRFQWE